MILQDIEECRRGSLSDHQQGCFMNDLLTQALQLPEQERAALTRQLLFSLEAEHLTTLARHLWLNVETGDWDSNNEAAWAKELEARMAGIDEGRYSARDWRDALADMRKSLTEGPSS
jgi:hypothetical protein